MTQGIHGKPDMVYWGKRVVLVRTKEYPCRLTKVNPVVFIKLSLGPTLGRSKLSMAQMHTYDRNG